MQHVHGDVAERVREHMYSILSYRAIIAIVNGATMQICKVMTPETGKLPGSDINDPILRHLYFTDTIRIGFESTRARLYHIDQCHFSSRHRRTSREEQRRFCEVTLVVTPEIGK